MFDAIDELQAAMRKRFSEVPEEGIVVTYLDQEFLVKKNVFWPFDDSRPLVEGMRIDPGERVLDVGTGTGVIAIHALLKGAGSVVALDVNPEAVSNARENAQRFGFSNKMEVRQSNVFSALVSDETFDVITANLPFRNEYASDLVEGTQWDTDLKVHRTFFSNVSRYLKPRGRIYIAQANFGEVEALLKLAEQNAFESRQIGERHMQNDFRIFYAFELTRGVRYQVPENAEMRNS